MEVNNTDNQSPTRKSLFSNIPPFFNYLPNGKSFSEAAPCQEHTDTMVDIRESLWRVPVAFTNIVNSAEAERSNQERCHKISSSSVDLPLAFTREKNYNKRRGIFRPKSVVLEDFQVPPASSKGFFTQQHNDSKSFMEEHFTVKISPFPSCHQIARKDHLWTNYKVSTNIYIWVDCNPMIQFDNESNQQLFRKCNLNTAGIISTFSRNPSRCREKEKI